MCNIFSKGYFATAPVLTIEIIYIRLNIGLYLVGVYVADVIEHCRRLNNPQFLITNTSVSNSFEIYKFTVNPFCEKPNPQIQIRHFIAI